VKLRGYGGKKHDKPKWNKAYQTLFLSLKKQVCLVTSLKASVQGL
jgi:hypothetical protein